jgi:hypothetical protein
MNFEVLTAVTMTHDIFWDVMLCILMLAFFYLG